MQMKNHRNSILLWMFTLLFLTHVQAVPISGITFDDPNLQACIEAKGATDTDQVTNLSCDNDGISSLARISHH